MSLPIDIFSWRLHYPGMVTNSSWCYKTFFWGNLDFPKIKKLKKVCSDVWTCTKMWEQCYFQAKLYSKAVYCFEKGLFLQFWLKVKSRFSRFPPKKSFITSTTGWRWSLARSGFHSRWPLARRNRQWHILFSDLPDGSRHRRGVNTIQSWGIGIS